MSEPSSWYAHLEKTQQELSEKCDDDNERYERVIETTATIDSIPSYSELQSNGGGLQASHDIDNNCEVFYILPRHKCNICNEIFNVVEQLSDHLNDIHTPKDQCLLCGEIFDIPLMLIEHMKNEHININPYRCKYCARRFSNRHLISQHYKYLHDILQKPYECDICGISFLKLYDIQNHKSDKHNKIINCPYCVKCFEKSYELKYHLNIHVYPEKNLDKNLNEFDVITLEDTITNDNIKLECQEPINIEHCYICGKYLQLNENFNEHLQIHKDEKFFECPDCQSLYEDFNEFIKHMENHSKVKITNNKVTKLSNVNVKTTTTSSEFIPKINCGFITPPRSESPETIRQTITTTTTTVQLIIENDNDINKNTFEKICILCKMIFRNIEEYDKHMKYHNKTMILRNTGPLGTISWNNKLHKSYPYYCKICKRYFVLGTSLLLHNKTIHKELKPYKCKICTMPFAQLSELRKHNETHPDNKQYSCKICDMKFSKRINLSLHKQHHTGRNVHNKCRYCGSDCPNTERLQEHVKKHLGDNIQECEFCEVPYAHLVDLNLHISRVHNVNPLRWQCRICSKMCNSAGEIMQHNRIMHAGEKPYKCAECDKSFALLHSLVNHKVVHSGRKDYKCEYCGKCFIYASYLKMHIRTHTGERPYICQYCPKTFSRLANLYEHKKQHLYTSRPYTCEICGGGYASISSLNKHKLLHDGIKKFQCNICSKSYIQKAHLERHKYSHNDIRSFICTLCNKKFRSPFTLTRHERKFHGIYKTKRKIEEMIRQVVGETYSEHEIEMLKLKSKSVKTLTNSNQIEIEIRCEDDEYNDDNNDINDINVVNDGDNTHNVENAGTVEPEEEDDDDFFNENASEDDEGEDNEISENVLIEENKLVLETNNCQIDDNDNDEEAAIRYLVDYE